MSSINTFSAFLADAASLHVSARSRASASESVRTASRVEAIPSPADASTLARPDAAGGRRTRAAGFAGLFALAVFAGFAGRAVRRVGLRRAGIALHHLIVQLNGLLCH